MPLLEAAGVSVRPPGPRGSEKQTTGAQYLDAHKCFTCRKIQGDIVGDTHGAALELSFQKLDVQSVRFLVVPDLHRIPSQEIIRVNGDHDKPVLFEIPD
jgi:hypothetical protein